MVIPLFLPTDYLVNIIILSLSTAGVNYEHLTRQQLIFDSINNAITVNVSIFINTNETSHEMDEDFTVSISFLGEEIPRVSLKPDSANVTIFEANGQGEIYITIYILYILKVGSVFGYAKLPQMMAI